LSYKSSLKILKDGNAFETGASFFTEKDASNFGGSSKKDIGVGAFI